VFLPKSSFYRSTNPKAPLSPFANFNVWDLFSFFQKPRVTNQTAFGFLKTNIPQHLFEGSKLTTTLSKVTGQPTTILTGKIGLMCKSIVP